MEPVTIIGSSIVEYMEIEGARKICRRGATLYRMKGEIENKEWIKLIVSGIPDIFERGGSTAVGPLIAMYERDLEICVGVAGGCAMPHVPGKIDG